MNRYHVFSSQKDEQAVLEVTRTDRRVAEQDAAIIKDILRRKSWVESQEGAS